MEWYEADESADATTEDWREWERQIKSKAPEYFRDMDVCELNEFYRKHPHDDIPSWMEAWTEAYIGSWPFEEIYARLKGIETTLDVLNKALGDLDPKISVAQLVRLKGGYQK